MNPESACPLCESIIYADPSGIPVDFLHCSHCDLWHRSIERRVSKAEESARYRQHNNDLSDPNYRTFLQPVVDALKPKLAQANLGLDYGCGPGPLLAEMWRECGFKVATYDPLFAPDDKALAVQYDFVTATEVVEHFREPKQDWVKLSCLVKPGGWLGIMTLLVQPSTNLATWFYAKDPTHMVFYSATTLQWIAQRFELTLHLAKDDRTALFQKL